MTWLTTLLAIAFGILRSRDRALWAWLSRIWPQWREVLVIVQSETVIAWRRQRFRAYRARLSRAGKPGRPAVPREIRDLIRRMSSANPLWGAPRIAGELGKIGIDIPRSTVANPTAEWTAQQIVEAFPWNEAPRFLLRDRDRIYGRPGCSLNSGEKVAATAGSPTFDEYLLVSPLPRPQKAEPPGKPGRFIDAQGRTVAPRLASS